MQSLEQITTTVRDVGEGLESTTLELKKQLDSQSQELEEHAETMARMVDIQGAWAKFQHEASSDLTRLEPTMNERVASKISEAVASIDSRVDAKVNDSREHLLAQVSEY